MKRLLTDVGKGLIEASLCTSFQADQSKQMKAEAVCSILVQPVLKCEKKFHLSHNSVADTD